MKKNNTWNIRHLVDDSFVPSSKQPSVFYCKLMDLQWVSKTTLRNGLPCGVVWHVRMALLQWPSWPSFLLQHGLRKKIHGLGILIKQLYPRYIYTLFFPTFFLKCRHCYWQKSIAKSEHSFFFAQYLPLQQCTIGLSKQSSVY